MDLDVRSEFVSRRPDQVLRPFVAWYAGYREHGVAPARHRGLPSPYLTLIVTLDDPLVVAAHPDPHAAPDQYETLVGGLHTAPAIITHDGRQAGIQVALSPLGAPALLGLPAGELAGADLHADEVLGRFGRLLRERVASARDWTERFAVLDRLFAARLAAGSRGAAVTPELGFAWHRLLDTGGTVAVESLAAEVGWSSRHLRQHFATGIGLTPKAVARVIRFDRARRLLQRRAVHGQRAELAALAATCGYYDQAHLAREFGQLAGCSPSRWLADEFRNIQAAAEAMLPDSVA